MSNILDDLFQWAGLQPKTNFVTVKIAIATHELTRNNLVSYAEGSLHYVPGHSSGMYYIPPYFSSERTDLKQYFSDRRHTDAPFNSDPNQIDPLSVTINSASAFTQLKYSITIKSSKWNFTFTFQPKCDQNSQILYETVGNQFITISLCNRDSVIIPK